MPSQAEIEAAAKAAHEQGFRVKWQGPSGFTYTDSPAWGRLSAETQDWYRSMAEAALTAAEKARTAELLEAKRLTDELMPDGKPDPKVDKALTPFEQERELRLRAEARSNITVEARTQPTFAEMRIEAMTDPQERAAILAEAERIKAAQTSDEGAGSGNVPAATDSRVTPPPEEPPE